MEILLYQVLLSLIFSILIVVLCYCVGIGCNRYKAKTVKQDGYIQQLFRASTNNGFQSKSDKRNYQIGRKCENNRKNKPFLDRCNGGNKYAKMLISYLKENNDKQKKVFVVKRVNALFIYPEIFRTEIFNTKGNLSFEKKIKETLYECGLLTITACGRYLSSAVDPWSSKESRFYRFNLEKIEKLIQKEG